jgi:predicted nucleic acid-binding protein
VEENITQGKVKNSPERLIVDANIIISALIKDSTKRALVFELPTILYAPDIILEEITSHKKSISLKSRLNEEDLGTVLDKILQYIHVLDEAVYESNLQKAYDVMKDIDSNDTLYVAAALSIKNDGIWSEDTDFEKQKIIKIWKTKDLIEKSK